VPNGCLEAKYQKKKKKKKNKQTKKTKQKERKETFDSAVRALNSSIIILKECSESQTSS